jgi:hypothetical protein
MPQTSVFLLVVAVVETVAKFILGDGSPCRASFLPASHNSMTLFWNNNTRQETHLVHDVFTLTELADYVLDCKSGRIFRQRFYQFAGMFDEHDADVDQTVQN